MSDMLVHLSYLASAAARPSVLLTLLALVGLAALFAGRAWARRVLLAAIGIQAAVLVLPVDQWAVHPLEEWVPQRHATPEKVDGIVVLGGALRHIVAADRGTPGLNSEGERMTTFAALAHRHPEAKLVFTGGMAALSPHGNTEAEAARTFFAQVGLDERIVYEDQADNTWENARLARALADPRPGETWVLVTSAMHMPRALAAFRAAGWDVLPYPTAYRTTRDLRWLPGLKLGDRLALLDAAAHEWVGLAVYWLRGRAVLGEGTGGLRVSAR